MPSPSEKVAVAESPNRDLNRVSKWSDFWGIQFNVIVSMSRTIHPQSTPFIISGWNCAEKSDLVIFRETFDAETTFAKHLRSVSGAAAHSLGTIRKFR